MIARRGGVIAAGLVVAMAACASLAGPSARVPAPDLDRDARRWVEQTLAALSLEQKVGQLVVPSFESRFTSTESDGYEALETLARDVHVGGFHVFGSTERAPDVLLNEAYGTVTLGDPFAAASLLNRLQRQAGVPLLNTADFETGVGFRLAGGTTFPRAMAFGAAGDESLAYEAGRITAIESRAIGVHVNFAPVADVNNNPRNPVINTRSFGEDPVRVGALAAAFARGLQAEGVLATLKHFPGHGDTDVDTHLGLATIGHTRERLFGVELAPFRAGIAAGSAAVMTAHIEVPVLDPAPGTPATLSRPMVQDVLRTELGFDGLVYTDSMSMQAITRAMTPGEAAVRAVRAGNDVVLHSPDPAAAVTAIREAVERGEIALEHVDASVRRLLTAKARLGLHRSRTVDLDALPARVGGRTHAAVADEVSQRAVTLVKDERGSVPLALDRSAAVLYLSLLDYPSGWRIGAPSRTLIPELEARWPDVTAIELSDRASASEIDLVRAMAPRFDAIVAATFVRTASFSGRMDLAPPLVGLLRDLARTSTGRGQPFVTIVFGNPYVATFLPELPAVMLTYDFYDRAETAAVRALTGDAAVTGRLPISLPGLFPLGHGLDRAAISTSR